MIQEIGYTQEGMVWANVAVNLSGQQGTLQLLMTPDNARFAIKGFTEALKEARRYERNGPNPDKGGTSAD